MPADDDPRVVVAEDACVLLVALGVGAYLAHLHVIGGVGRVVEHDAVFAFQSFLGGVESLGYETLFESDARHCAPSLALDEYLALLVLVGAYLVAEEVVGAQIPLSVPSVLLDGFYHLVYVFLGAVGLVVLAYSAAQLHIVLARHDEESCYHERLRLGTLALVLGGLEALVRVP